MVATGIDGYVNPLGHGRTAASCTRNASPLFVSIGIGPDEAAEVEKELVAGVDYEIPEHEKYRLSRRSKLDVQCDQWYGDLLGEENGVLGSVAEEARKILATPVPLLNDVSP